MSEKASNVVCTSPKNDAPSPASGTSDERSKERLNEHGLIMTSLERGRYRKLQSRAISSYLPAENNDDTLVRGKSNKKKRKKKKQQQDVSKLFLSGLTTWQEAEELTQLMQTREEELTLLESRAKTKGMPFVKSIEDLEDVSFGASIHVEGNNKTFAGHEHRDLLLRLLFHNGLSPLEQKHLVRGTTPPVRHDEVNHSDKKQKIGHGKAAHQISMESSLQQRQQQVLQQWAKNNLPPPPINMRVHNAACFKNVAVLEFALGLSEHEDALIAKPGGILNQSNFFEGLCSQKGLHGRRATRFPSALFQGDNPKSVTEMLCQVDYEKVVLPLKTPISQGGSAASNRNRSVGPNSSLYERMVALALTSAQRVDEDYPNTNPYKRQPLQKDLIYKIGCIGEALSQHLGPIRDAVRLPFAAKEALDIVTQIGEEEIKAGGQAKKNVMPSQDPASAQNELLPVVDVNDNKFVSSVLSDDKTRKRSPKVFAIDCEMVKTVWGYELARVSLIQLDGQSSSDTKELNKEDGRKESVKYEVVMDLLVQPRNTIVDYVTGTRQVGR
jgi:hypothetical protein